MARALVDEVEAPDAMRREARAEGPD